MLSSHGVNRPELAVRGADTETVDLPHTQALGQTPLMASGQLLAASTSVDSHMVLVLHRNLRCVAWLSRSVKGTPRAPSLEVIADRFVLAAPSANEAPAPRDRLGRNRTRRQSASIGMLCRSKLKICGKPWSVQNKRASYSSWTALMDAPMPEVSMTCRHALWFFSGSRSQECRRSIALHCSGWGPAHGFT